MPYVTLDDNFAEHPKNDALSDAAFRLHVAGICYCNRHRTDGTVPVERIQRLVPRFRPKALEELLKAGQWIDRHDGSYYIHDYLEWNKSREQIEKLHNQQSRKGQKGASVRWPQP